MFFKKSNIFFLFLFYLKIYGFQTILITLCWFVTYLDVINVIKIAHKKVGRNGTIQEHVAIFY